MQIRLKKVDNNKKILWMHFENVTLLLVLKEQEPRETEAQHNADKHFACFSDMKGS